MFPQSELENYKLQVELLQEKLQRSEISRQQLEHKLDKILQKRDEHDKIVRAKSKQKYQQFLEEQQRRNERNKQLVEMLERIEQQTAAMNARSERLKMMKLQYEMYFAKLVHSQTRRCLQTSVMAMTTPQMMAAASTTSIPASVIGGVSAQPMTMTNIHTPVADGRYPGGYPPKVYEEPTFMPNNYQRYEMDATFDQRRKDNSSDSPLMGMSNSDITFNSSFRSSDSADVQKVDIPRPYLAQERRTEVNMKMDNGTRGNFNFPNTRGYELKSHPSEILENSNKVQELDMSITTTTPSSISDANNYDVVISKQNMVPHTGDTFKGFENKNGTIKDNEEPNQRPRNIIPTQNPLELKSEIVVDKKDKEQIQGIATKPAVVEDSQRENTELPNIEKQDKPETMNTEQQKSSVEIPDEIPEKSSVEISQQRQSEEETQAKEQTPIIEDKTPTTSAPSMSIENIENAIYGELVNSSEGTEKIPPADMATVPSTLLENLVTEAAAASEEVNKPEIQQPSDNGEKYNVEIPYDREKLMQEIPMPPETYEYVTADTVADDDNNVTTTEEYAGYDSNANITDDGQQEQQEYDYSNYDPSQYSYPGYIYDETTGEYKPDPNASAEQYAQDQQYAEDYDQQYQQQEAYDYNQTYDQQEIQESDATQDTAATYENYDTTQQVEPTSAVTEEPVQEGGQETQQNQDATETELTTKPQTTTTKPTSILATGDKKDGQKNKKRVNFVDSSETDESSVDKAKTVPAAAKPSGGNESDFDFSSSSDIAPEAK
ncbi:dentin sialophosphoprotein [Musca domestica]|uniref:Dentin sialophosphoprotein n=1 Tax=Musca domestica TaxID=7370 RepID=A0ABM3V5U6_MUSDO|nr:dentin sialophosphoprotein [Musca domestica]